MEEMGPIAFPSFGQLETSAWKEGRLSLVSILQRLVSTNQCMYEHEHSKAIERR